MAAAVTAPAAFDVALPSRLEVGRGAVLLVRGWIVPPPGARLRGFDVDVDGERQRFGAQGEVRFDLPTVRGRPPLGIFLPVAITPRRAGRTVRVRVVARLGDGEQLLVERDVELLPSARAPLAIDTPVVICLGTYNPDEPLLVRQLDSLRAQTRRDWTCIVRDDGSTPERFAMVERHVAGDARFRLVRSDGNGGFYRNFEALLALVPPTTKYVALCDQDDCWYPDKLAATIAALDAEPAAQLAYCDMRIVDRAGAVRSSTYWRTRRNNYRQLDTLLFANTVTGAASVFRGALLDALLPFPPSQGPAFHDHWIACCALVAGGIAYVDRPLYDYTQHGANVVGHADFGPLTVAGALKRHAFNTAEMLLKPPRTLDNIWSMLSFYHFGYRRIALIAATLQLRFPSLAPEVARTLALFDDRVGNAWPLMLSRHFDIIRRGDTTDGAEFKLGMGLLLHKTISPALIPLIAAKRRWWPG